MGTTELIFTCRVKTLLPKCAKYFQNVTCTSRMCHVLHTWRAQPVTQQGRDQARQKAFALIPRQDKVALLTEPWTTESPRRAVQTPHIVTRHKTALDKGDQLIPTRH